MARLVNPGLGDKVDRLSILTLKLRHHGHQEHWAREAAVLEVETRAVPVRLAVELTAVNAMLWQAEDELRRYRDVDAAGDHDFDWKTAALCAFRIQDLNDTRAQLVQQINAHAGDDLGPEKGPRS
jgi:hypothetical protein